MGEDIQVLCPRCRELVWPLTIRGTGVSFQICPNCNETIYSGMQHDSLDIKRGRRRERNDR